MSKYINIFSPGKIGSKIVKNRIFFAPMGENMANSDGSVSEQEIHYYQKRAEGGTGLIIPGTVCVDYPQGKCLAQQLRLDHPRFINGWNKMAEAVHRYGALLMPQLQHAGIGTDIVITEGLEPVILSENIDENQAQLVGNKPKSKYVKSEKKVLTTEDIKQLEQKFIQAAIYAKMATCDGVMLHGGAHYLIGNFIAEGTNQRTDEYGGSLENRLRFACNVIRGIREACGKDFAVGIRISAYWEDCEENRFMAKSFEKAGADFIDATFPIVVTKQTQFVETSEYPEGDRGIIAKNIMGVVNIPVLNNGNYKTPEVVEQALADGIADFIGMGRALLCDPDWCNKAMAEKAEEIRTCLSCCECSNNNQYSRGLRCALNPEMGREYEHKLLTLPQKNKKVVIIGGGIAGMQAAITATKRGHKVIILEKSDKLGGQMHLACVPPHKQLIAKNIHWFADECARLGVEVHLHTEGTIERIKEFSPDHVIIAIGSLPFTAPIKGVENTIQAWDILNGKVDIPQKANISIIGGGIVGCEVAELLAEKENKVIVLEKLAELAPDMPWTLRTDMFNNFAEKNIVALSKVDIQSINSAKELIYEKDGQKVLLQMDMIILATGQKSIISELPALLTELKIPYNVIGDAVRPGRFISATTAGYFAGINL